MPIQKESIWKKYMCYVRDVIYIAGILIAVYGWVRSETINKTNLENKVEVLTKSVDDNTKQLEKINEILLQQSQLNGKIIQYMEIKK